MISLENHLGGYDYSESGLMTTDVKDTDKGYEVTMNMPGVEKRRCKSRTERWLSDSQC